MITRRDLDEAIGDLENKNPTMEGCIRLAALYTVRSHLFGDGPDTYGTAPAVESVIGSHGDSEFLRVITGQESDHVWRVIDETMSALKLTEPRLYNSVLRKIQQ